MSSLLYLVVLDFGYPKRGYRGKSSIDDLCTATLRRCRNYSEDEVMILAQSACYHRLWRTKRFSSKQLRRLKVGQSGSLSLKKGTTYEVLQVAKLIIERHDFEHRLAKMSGERRFFASGPQVEVITHACHVERAIRQGQKLGLAMHPAPHLPTSFYTCATQWWCRNQLAWDLREAMGHIPLKLARQI